MQIELADSSELANHPYTEIEPGKLYKAPGRVLILEDDDHALLIIQTDHPTNQ